MQDDREHIVHAASEQVRQYAAIGKWLDGLMIERIPGGGETCPRVVLNQHSTSRPAKDLFAQRQREIRALAQELVDYTVALKDDEFFDPFQGCGGNSVPTHHVVTSVVAQHRTTTKVNAVGVSLAKKLHELEKYETSGLDEMHLVVHNFVPICELSTRLWHEYYHYRNAILSDLASRATRDPSHVFSRFFFLDYSQHFGGCHLYDLSTMKELGIHRPTTLRERSWEL
jgi:hypothetical protein